MQANYQAAYKQSYKTQLWETTTCSIMMQYITICHMLQNILHRRLLAAYFSTDFDCHIWAETDNPSCFAKVIHPHEPVNVQ